MSDLPGDTSSISVVIAERIEDLYGEPLAALADTTGERTLLGALTRTHSALALAERNIAFQLGRLRELAAPEREIGHFEAGHILDCARRIAESVAARDAYATGLNQVLNGLRRAPAPQATPAIPPAPAPSRAR